MRAWLGPDRVLEDEQGESRLEDKVWCAWCQTVCALGDLEILRLVDQDEPEVELGCPGCGSPAVQYYQGEPE